MLGGEVDLGHCAVEGGEIEERVVAETAGAAGRFEDESFDCSMRGVEGQAVAGGDKDTAITGGALGQGHAGEVLQKDHVVPDVGVVVGVGGVGEAGIGGKTGGADAGRAAEGIDFEAGVVGEDKLARGAAGVVAGLESGVGGEGGAVFFRGGNGGETGQGLDVDGMSLGCGAEVSEFALAGGGGVEVEGHG